MSVASLHFAMISRRKNCFKIPWPLVCNFWHLALSRDGITSSYDKAVDFYPFLYMSSRSGKSFLGQFYRNAFVSERAKQNHEASLYISRSARFWARLVYSIKLNSEFMQISAFRTDILFCATSVPHILTNLSLHISSCWPAITLYIGSSTSEFRMS